MKLGDFFVELGIKSDSKSIKAIEEHINSLKKLQKKVAQEIKLEKELAEAKTEEQKARIKKKYNLDKEIKLQETNLKQQKAQIANFRGMIKGAIGVATAIAGVVFAVDRMANSLARSNQRLMNFQHQTGISISTLNKYANANVAVNPLASLEGTASSLQNVARNLWDIQLGRGDVSAFQELSYFSGQQVEPYGKSIEEVIESVRNALRYIPNDVQATNLIQRMGFSPDDLKMLRMTRKEFDAVQDVMLNATQRKQLEKYGKELNLIHLQFKKLYDLAVIKLAPGLNNGLNAVLPVVSSLSNDLDTVNYIIKTLLDGIWEIRGALLGLFVIVQHKIAIILGVFLLLEDIVSFFEGKESFTGDFIKFITTELPRALKDLATNLNNTFKGSGVTSAMDFMKNLVDILSRMMPMGVISNNLAWQGVGNNGGNNYNQTNYIDIKTNNPSVARDGVMPVIQQNYARSGGQ